jgi:hypothetical protein
MGKKGSQTRRIVRMIERRDFSLKGKLHTRGHSFFAKYRKRSPDGAPPSDGPGGMLSVLREHETHREKGVRNEWHEEFLTRSLKKR